MKRLLLFILVLFVTAPVGALTRGDIRDQIRLFVNDTDTSLPNWTDAQLNTRIEMAQIDVVKFSRCLQNTTYYTMVASQTMYAIGQDMLSIERVSYYIVGSTSGYRNMKRYTIPGLDTENDVWENSTRGQPDKYYIWSSTIGLVTPPSISYSGKDKLKIQYVVMPSSFVADTSVPFNDVPYLYPYHELIIWYVVSMCKVDERLYSDAQYFDTKYYNLLKIMIAELQNKPNYFPDFRFTGPGYKGD